MTRLPGVDWAKDHPTGVVIITARKAGTNTMDTAGERPVEMKGETLNEETGKFNPGDHDDRGGRSGVCS